LRSSGFLTGLFVRKWRVPSNQLKESTRMPFSEASFATQFFQNFVFWTFRSSS
jgi:hypothetical protein